MASRRQTRHPKPPESAALPACLAAHFASLAEDLLEYPHWRRLVSSSLARNACTMYLAETGQVRIDDEEWCRLFDLVACAALEDPRSHEEQRRKYMSACTRVAERLRETIADLAEIEQLEDTLPEFSEFRVPQDAREIYVRAARELCDRFRCYVEPTSDGQALSRLSRWDVGHYLPTTGSFLEILVKCLDDSADRACGDDPCEFPFDVLAGELTRRRALPRTDGPAPTVARLVPMLRERCALQRDCRALRVVPSDICLAMLAAAAFGYKEEDIDQAEIRRALRRTRA